jgi:hypothetical protein
MPPDMIWNVIQTGGLAAAGWFLNTLYSELHRQQILLNKTREEIAKEYVTKTDAHADINRVIARLDAMDSKFDRLIERLTK